MLATQPVSDRMVGRVPIQNLWLLMLYASDLSRIDGDFNALIDRDINNLPDLVARLLADCVQRRLRNKLTRAYRQRHMVLTRVRGGIDILATEAGQHLSKGEVVCRFEDLTIDTTRNRLVRAALDCMAGLVFNEELAHQCRSLSRSLAMAGVLSLRPSRSELTLDQIGRNDSGDRFMVTLSRLAFELALPTENPGPKPFASPDRDEVWVRRLFEKAVLGFARVELEPLGWSVRGGVHLDWQVSSLSSGLADILPRMVTDIVLDAPTGCRIVIDTKFTSILTKGRFNKDILKSGYLYQMYAYIRSQEDRDSRWKNAEGLLLHPAIGEAIHEHVTIQNHLIRFATVDLHSPAMSIRKELRALLRGNYSF